MEEPKAPGCEQSNELIAFLYGELNDIEAQSFQRHMKDCSSCGQELAAFSDIRSLVVAWRGESLGRISAHASLPHAIVDPQRNRPSAWAAVRAFFDLSPAWLKGSVAFASLLFCILAGLAISRLDYKPTVPVAGNAPTQDASAYTEQQVKALVDQRVKDEIDRLKTFEQSPAPQVVSDAKSNRRNATPNLQVATNAPSRRPLSKVERDQLAADLRLVAINNDSELDLLDDRINQ